jgi:hypothetical protein
VVAISAATAGAFRPSPTEQPESVLFLFGWLRANPRRQSTTLNCRELAVNLRPTILPSVREPDLACCVGQEAIDPSETGRAVATKLCVRNRRGRNGGQMESWKKGGVAWKARWGKKERVGRGRRRGKTGHPTRLGDCSWICLLRHRS